MLKNCLLLLVLALVGSIECQDKNKLNLFVGVGYDLAFGNPYSEKVDSGFRAPIFNFTFKNSQLTSDGRFLIPDGADTVNRQQCEFLQSSSEFTGTSDYQNELKTVAAVSGGHNSSLVQGAFTANAEFLNIEKTTRSENKVIIQTGTRCQTHQIDLPTSSALELNANFKNHIKSALTNANGITWRKVIQTFGTHYAERIIFGGKTLVQYKIKMTDYQELKTANMDLKLIAKLTLGQATTMAETNEVISMSNEIKSFKKRVESTREIIIGTKLKSNIF
jgi:hypothetical protein